MTGSWHPVNSRSVCYGNGYDDNVDMFGLCGIDLFRYCCWLFLL